MHGHAFYISLYACNSYKYPPRFTPSTFGLANPLVRVGWKGPLICLASPSSYGKGSAGVIFPQNGTLCPVETLRYYEQATAPLIPKDTSKLLVAIVKPHKPVASCTIACWLRKTLKLAGIDALIFATRGVSTSAAGGTGVTTADIMNAANWNMDSFSGDIIIIHLMMFALVEQYYPLHLPVKPDLVCMVVDLS